jgi:hypothetical protein
MNNMSEVNQPRHQLIFLQIDFQEKKIQEPILYWKTIIPSKNYKGPQSIHDMNCIYMSLERNLVNPI